MMNPQATFTPAPIMADRLDSMLAAIKTETRWQVIAAERVTDAALYAKCRAGLVEAMRKIRARDVSPDVLTGVVFWNAVEAYGELFAALIQHRKAARATA